jgi:Ternary complex associated domain 9
VSLQARTRVYVSAAIEGVLSPALLSRNLNPEGFANGIADVDKAVSNPECRAIIVHVPSPTVKSQVRRELLTLLEGVARKALDLGVLVVLAVEGSGQGDATGDVTLVTEDLARTFPISAELPHIDRYRFQPNLFHFSPPANVESIAQQCAEWNPGRYLGTAKILPVGGLTLSDEERVLMKRSFNDAEAIEVSWLARRVYRVQPCRSGTHLPLVYVVKIGRPDSIDRELGAVEICARYTPYPYLPPLAHDRCVSGRSTQALVSHFVDRAIEFKDFIRSHSPAMAVASLFDGPLRVWHAHAIRKRINVVKYLFEKRVVSERPADYVRTFNKLRASGVTCRSPDQLINQLLANGEHEIFVCMAHGDLHLRNLRVRDNTAEIVMIDFARADPQAPASRDPAELEVSLAFGCDPRTSPPLREREALYTRELLKFHAVGRNAHPCISAIEQIRSQIGRMVSEDEYRVMVAAHCLFYARKGSTEAYAAANRLV